MMLLFLQVAGTGCARGDETAGFRDENPTPYNQKIERGQRQRQAWTATPRQIIQHLFEPESDEGGDLFTFQQTRHVNGSRTVTITEEGLLDDEVYGERRVLTFVVKQGGWVVKQVKVGYKFQKSDQAYSGQGCGR
ncbi:hypothetical protein [Hymenobacter sp. B1770]|uniref:hypothetical protein n=1 Tax=Hymenobacter sp. B1770 TaxID=1718788 RepID=UPI003CF3D020